MFGRTQNVLKFFFLSLSTSRQIPGKYLNFEWKYLPPNHFKFSLVFDAAYFEILTKVLNKLKGISKYVFPTV